MPDKTHYDLETLILMIIAMLNPMVAVFMMKGCGGQFIICLLLFITLFVFLASLLFSTYPADSYRNSLFPAWIYAYVLVADRHKRKKSGLLVVVGVPGKVAESKVVQLQRTSTVPPAVQTIEYRPQPVLAAPAPPAPVIPAPAPPSPATATEQVVVVTKAPDVPPPTPVVVPVAAPK
jgi:uncharacterized membrane protein YqaE (UPF0057 family)